MEAGEVSERLSAASGVCEEEDGDYDDDKLDGVCGGRSGAGGPGGGRLGEGGGGGGGERARFRGVL